MGFVRQVVEIYREGKVKNSYSVDEVIISYFIYSFCGFLSGFP